MRLFEFVYRLGKSMFKSRLAESTKSALRIAPLLLAGLSVAIVAGCGQTSPREVGSEVVGQVGTVTLPTPMPTVAPSPVSTRVMPLEVMTAVPTSPITPTVTPIPDEVRALVVEVIDGDTIAVVMAGDPPSRVYVVRYLGIDAPPNEPDSPWGRVAYETNRKLTNLKAVRLVRDQSQSDQDEEGRLLRHVFIGNDLLSILLAEQGLARADNTEPDLRFQAEIEEAETRARNNRLGLWGQPPTLVPPISTQPAGTDEATTEPEATATGTATPAANTPSADDTAVPNVSVTPSEVAEEGASDDQSQEPE
jgi:endonuclease YncB( thermonuclease family)